MVPIKHEMDKIRQHSCWNWFVFGLRSCLKKQHNEQNWDCSPWWHTHSFINYHCVSTIQQFDQSCILSQAHISPAKQVKQWFLFDMRENWNGEKARDMSKATQLASGRTWIRTRSSDACSKVLAPSCNLSSKKHISKTLILKTKKTDFMRLTCWTAKINRLPVVEVRRINSVEHLISPRLFLERMTEVCTNIKMELSICVFTASTITGRNWRANGWFLSSSSFKI